MMRDAPVVTRFAGVRELIGEGAPQGITTQHGQPTRAAAKRAKAMSNSVEAVRGRREPPVIDRNEAIANLLDIPDDIYERRG